MRDVDTPKTMLVRIGRRLVTMLERLDAITHVLRGFGMELNVLYYILFQLRPSLLYMPKAERVVKFITDNDLLGTTLGTFELLIAISPSQIHRRKEGRNQR